MEWSLIIACSNVNDAGVRWTKEELEDGHLVGGRGTVESCVTIFISEFRVNTAFE
jgi:hypothetical protein